MPPPPTQCPCGAAVPPTTGKGRPWLYCGPACAQQAHRVRQQAHAADRKARRTTSRQPRPCGVCGKPYQWRSAVQRYCGDTCRQLAALKRAEDRKTKNDMLKLCGLTPEDLSRLS